MARSTRPSLPALAGAAVLVTALAACGSTPSPAPAAVNTPAAPSPAGRTADASAASTASTADPAAQPVDLSANVKDGATKVTVDTRVKVRATAGTVTKVKLTYRGTDARGRRQTGTVDGAINGDQTSWSAGDRLEPGTAYKLTMVGENAAGKRRSSTKSFRTESLTLAEQTLPTVQPAKGSTVGVGMPVVLTFDVPIKDKAEVERHLHVTSSPAQPGSWHWYSATQVHFRPATYWTPGTTVRVKADTNGVDAGNGIYGQKSVSTRFTVGRQLITKINLKTDVAKVYRNGKLVRTIPVSGGKPGWRTRSGIKLIMAKEYNKTMTNEDIGAAEEYSLTAAHALRVTNSGEFLHSAPWNTANFGRRNASHGCVGMSNANAAWLSKATLIGDPVVTTGSDRGIEPGNGWSDWNASFKTYQKGSAL